MDKNNVVINKKIFGTSKSFEVTGDIIVPDIKPDIVSIINANANSYIYKDDILTPKYNNVMQSLCENRIEIKDNYELELKK